MTKPASSPFWNFSLRIYRKPGIPQACLTLQDQHGVDVNVMLYALWLASQGRSVSKGDMAAIVEAMESWRQQVVAPLREVRRILRDPALAAGPGAAGLDREAALALREKIKAVELEAERLQQEALFALRPAAQWGTPADRQAAAAGNFDTYAAVIGADFDASARKTLLDGFEQVEFEAGA